MSDLDLQRFHNTKREIIRIRELVEALAKELMLQHENSISERAQVLRAAWSKYEKERPK